MICEKVNAIISVKELLKQEYILIDEKIYHRFVWERKPFIEIMELLNEGKIYRVKVTDGEKPYEVRKTHVK